jgi:hypothetical protein
MKDTLITLIRNHESSVFFYKEFAELIQMNSRNKKLRNIINQLLNENILIRIGHGLYARAKISQISGRCIPEKPLPELARETLHKLNKQTFPSSAEQAYNQGISTQVPTGRVIGVKGCCISRKIGFNGSYVVFEYIRR